jgi:dTDP-glucose 4,6-dehydratase
MRSLLVTGGAGFIGSAFTARALSRGHRVCVVDALLRGGHRSNLAAFEKNPGFHFVHGSIADTALIERVLSEFKPDAILNFAAESHVDRSIEAAAPFVQTNIVGVFHLLECARSYFDRLDGKNKKQFRFLQVSTDEVFGSLGADGYFSELSPYRPRSPYSASKAAADHLVSSWFSTYGLPTLITYSSNNYGPRQHPEKLIPCVIVNALAGKPIPVYGNGENVRDWIYVDDHCDGLLLALEQGKTGESYCLGGQTERTNLSVVQTICSLLDQAHPKKDGSKHGSLIQFVADRPGHDWRYATDNSKALQELGFSCRKDFKTGLSETVQWYLDHPDWIKALGSDHE